MKTVCVIEVYIVFYLRILEDLNVYCVEKICFTLFLEVSLKVYLAYCCTVIQYYTEYSEYPVK